MAAALEEPKAKFGVNYRGSAVDMTAKFEEKFEAGVATETKVIEDPDVEFYVTFGRHRFLAGKVTV